jgi:hypothetical protein
MAHPVSLTTVQAVIRRALTIAPEQRSRIEKAAVLIALDQVQPTGELEYTAISLTDPRAHHTDGARAAIEARGARLLFLPPYSPDFNPIEHAFSKVKQVLRRAAARTDDALRAATWAVFATITPTDIAGWFSHCGYGPLVQGS